MPRPKPERPFRLTASASLALFALWALAPAPLAAQAYGCRPPASVTVPPVVADAPARRVPVTGYTLALTWSPEFCRGHAGAPAHARQCDDPVARYGLVVHGLWPEGRGSSWPQWCAARPAPAAAQVRANLCLTPDAGLIAHEWAKHGTCMARSAETYLKVTRILYRGLRLPDLDRLSREPKLTAGFLRARFAEANPGWRPGAIGIARNPRGWLTEIKLCYDKRFMPEPCDARRLGARDGDAVKIWRGL